MKNDFKTFKIIISAIAFIFIIAVAATFGVLLVTDAIKWDVSPFLLMFTILTLGSGLYVVGFSIFSKSGYTYSVGAILTDVGVILLLITLKVKLAVIIIVGFAVFAIFLVSLFIVKAKQIAQATKTTDEDENFVPYMEKLKKEQEEAKNSEEPLPEIKSFKD